MSVAVLHAPAAYCHAQEHYAITSHSDSDSDTGYRTPAEIFHPVAVVQQKETPVDSSSDEEPGEIVVDPDLEEKIVKQVEWYFSDENLLKDSFLMKHINRNKQGYVSLKLVASLRKVKTLSKDWKLVLDSLKRSTLLALNEEETKIRRTSPAPQVDFSHISKTLLITGYPHQEPNLADVEQHFGRYGEVIRVRLVCPGRAIPLDIKPCKAQCPSLGKDLCILIQYKTQELAKSALKKICEQQSWRDEMKVQLLGGKNLPDQEPKDQEDKTSPLNKKRKGESKSPEVQSSQSTKNYQAPRQSRDYSPSQLRNSREVTPIKVLQQKGSPPSSPITHRRNKSKGIRSSPELSRRYLRPEYTRNDYSSDSGISSGCRSSSESPKMTPESSRRFFSSSFGETSWRSADKHSHMNSCVIRQPLGPDGTRGFTKQRVSPISIAVQSY